MQFLAALVVRSGLAHQPILRPRLHRHHSELKHNALWVLVLFQTESPQRSLPSSTSVPLSTTQTPSVDPIYAAIESAIINAESNVNRRESARDVWYFIKPAESDKEPPELQAAQLLENAPRIIASKPDSPFLVCRLCRCVLVLTDNHNINYVFLENGEYGKMERVVLQQLFDDISSSNTPKSILIW